MSRHRPRSGPRSRSTATTSPSRSAADDVNAAVSPVSAVPRGAAPGCWAAARRSSSGRRTAGSWSRAATSARWSGPDAPVKVYLTADAVGPRPRRAAEEGGTDVEATRESLLARDQIDSGRAVSPLVMADGAVHVDTTAYTLDEVIDQVVRPWSGAA